MSVKGAVVRAVDWSVTPGMEDTVVAAVRRAVQQTVDQADAVGDAVYWSISRDVYGAVDEVLDPDVLGLLRSLWGRD